MLYFSFPVVIIAAASHGITAIIQTEGGKRDALSIQEWKKNRISIIISGVLNYKHRSAVIPIWLLKTPGYLCRGMLLEHHCIDLV